MLNKIGLALLALAAVLAFTHYALRPGPIPSRALEQVGVEYESGQISRSEYRARIEMMHSR